MSKLICFKCHTVFENEEEFAEHLEAHNEEEIRESQRKIREIAARHEPKYRDRTEVKE